MTVSKRVAKTASKVLRDGRFGATAKTPAGSALSNYKPSKKNSKKK